MTEARCSEYEKFKIESAEQYLQTVVLIDDQIYEIKRETVSDGVDASENVDAPSETKRKPATKKTDSSTDKSAKVVEMVEVPKEPDVVSFQDVQKSFAKKHIICSLYQPDKSESLDDQSDIYKLCSTADVIIVDWSFNGDAGDKASALIEGLVKQSCAETPQQLRLVLVYTKEQDLKAVADRISKKLTKRLDEDNVSGESQSEGLVFITNNTRVVVLGKPESRARTTFPKDCVQGSKLATRTIEEFSELASGLLQGIVLRGIAKLRENNRRILTRFHKDLDIAFLTHRALQLPDEAFGQIIPLLTDELRAVLEDTLGESPLGTFPAVKEILADWCDEYWKTRTDDELIIGDNKYDLEFVKDVLCNEPVTKKKKNILSKNWKADYCHEKLGSLMSQRTRYDNSRRTLHLGVMVRELADKERYMLCLQPVCDSVRIGGESRAFIFCVLNEPKDGKGFTHCVIDGSDNVIKLEYKPEVSGVFVSYFKPGTDTVCANKDDTNRFIFKDENGKDYKWIAELKTEHAQRAAEQFGRELSRVGLTESEWLRRKAK